MRYQIRPSSLFIRQFSLLSAKSQRIVKKKIELLQDSPFRFKRLTGLSGFRVRLNDRGKELRLIYQILDDEILLVGIFDRKNDYKDIKEYLDG